MNNSKTVSPLKKAEEIDMNRVIEAVAHMTGRSVGHVRDTWLIAKEEAGGNVKTALLNFITLHFVVRE